MVAILDLNAPAHPDVLMAIAQVTILYLFSSVRNKKYNIQFSISNNDICIHFHIGIADCIWASWEDWSVCSKSCGGGMQMRTRRVKNYETKGGTCNGKSAEQQACSTEACMSKWYHYVYD